MNFKLLQNKNHFKINFLVVLIVLLILIEFFVTLNIYYWDKSLNRTGTYYKLFFQLILIFSIDYRKLDVKMIKLILLLFLFFFINQIIYNSTFIANIFYHINKGSVYYLDKLLLFFFFVLAYNTWSDKNRIGQKVLKSIKYILIINALFILLGFLFDLKFFESYPGTSRFGYDGLFNKPNEVSYFYIIYIFHLYNQVVLQKKQKLRQFIFILFISLLIGTKSTLLFLCLLVIYHFLIVVKGRKTLKIIFSTLLVTTLLFSNWILNFFFNLSTFWRKLNVDYNLITLLSSKRDVLFQKNLEYIDNCWGSVNYFIGGSHYSKIFVFTQMDGPDLILFFGVIGFIIYLKLLFTAFLNKQDNIIKGLVVLIFISGFFSGALLTNIIAMIFLFLILKNNILVSKS